MNIRHSIQCTYAAFLLAAYLPLTTQAQTVVFDKATWMNLATQTCIQQAPHHSSVQAMDLSERQLRYNCQCVASDMLSILSLKDRQQMLYSMQTQRNVQNIVERMMAKHEVKQAVLACSAAAWWQ